MIDITRALRSGHPNWPGDTPFELRPSAAIADGSPVNLMSLTTSTHSGSHIDAPYHTHDGGGRLGSIPLELLLGEALVVGPFDHDTIGPAQMPGGRLPERVLFATGQPDGWQEFPSRFSSLDPDLIHSLADRGVRLVGIDTPSVDRIDSKLLPSHAACRERLVTIVEGLRLARVAPGRYRLLCLPMSLPEADAAPVRALLLPL